MANAKRPWWRIKTVSASGLPSAKRPKSMGSPPRKSRRSPHASHGNTRFCALPKRRPTSSGWTASHERWVSTRPGRPSSQTRFAHNIIFAIFPCIVAASWSCLTTSGGMCRSNVPWKACPSFNGRKIKRKKRGSSRSICWETGRWPSSATPLPPWPVTRAMSSTMLGGIRWTTKPPKISSGAAIPSAAFTSNLRPRGSCSESSGAACRPTASLQRTSSTTW